MTAPRRWFRVWFRYDGDPLRSEDTLMVQATDEHAIYKQMAHEHKRVTACYAQYPDQHHPTPEETAR